MEFTPINTQEELDALIKDRLDRERRKVEKEIRAEFSDYEELKGKLGTLTTDNQSLTERVTTLEAEKTDLAAKLSASETDSAKTRIAFECGIPFEMCSRLAGSTEDEIRADAENMKKFFQMQQPSAPLYNPDSATTDQDKALTALSNSLKMN